MNILFEHMEFIVMHTFVYARVSTADQTNDNQLLEIEQAGYDAYTVYTDTVSGKIPANERPEFSKMLDTVTRTRKRRPPGGGRRSISRRVTSPQLPPPRPPIGRALCFR